MGHPPPGHTELYALKLPREAPASPWCCYSISDTGARSDKVVPLPFPPTVACCLVVHRVPSAACLPCAFATIMLIIFQSSPSLEQAEAPCCGVVSTWFVLCGVKCGSS